MKLCMVGQLFLQESSHYIMEENCMPKEEGGIGICRLKDINLYMLMKMSWAMLKKSNDWSTFMQGEKPYWVSFLWEAKLHPRTATIGWKIMLGAVNTDDRMQNIKFRLASRCIACKDNTDTQSHTFYECGFAMQCWNYATNTFVMQQILGISHTELVEVGASLDPQAKAPWGVASISCLVAIWRNRNKMIYEEGKPNFPLFVKQFEEASILVLKVSAAGSIRGSYGITGWGFVCRDHTRRVHGVGAGGIGIDIAHNANCQAILEGVTQATNMGWRNIWVESQSKAAVNVFQLDEVHWRIKSA
ncbi:hypothetical protein IFM89_038593 [Coptis chinensis]|uniref:Reverse transcriptase zinc-binding domain-containing protein n=1 Tax=Coptis chinensis TaxID=261450 RepID=A0A835LQ56_9MAGN|nr:hypothetical protein IFM89_038593 [Coptis chinensis]